MRFIGAAAVAALVSVGHALDFSATDPDSIVDPSYLVLKGVMDYYNGNKSGGTPGMFQQPYYWWEAGVAWGAVLEHIHFTGNKTYEDLVKTSILFQSGNYWNFMTFNQSSVEGNDDQAFWGITAMAAAERNFTLPGKGWPSTWLYFAQATFNSMANRWDTTNCGGGLRWQIYTWNAGYDYKNSVSNGCLFHLAARLYRFTNNATFAVWAEKVWQWMESVKLLETVRDGSVSSTRVYDGAGISNNCGQVAQYEWSYDQGLMISGAAAMYNATGNTTWLNRAESLWNRALVFFVAVEGYPPAMLEAACQPRQSNGNWSQWTHNGNWSASTCDNDQRVFKGIFSRFLGLTMALVPQSKNWIWNYMVGTGQAVAQSCSGGFDGHTCGLNWLVHGYDGVYGLGEQISALDVMSVLMSSRGAAPYRARDLPEVYGSGSIPSSNSTNGTSSGDDGAVFGYGDAGLNTSTSGNGLSDLIITGKDRAGAGVITAFSMLLVIGTSCWLIL